METRLINRNCVRTEINIAVTKKYDIPALSLFSKKDFKRRLSDAIKSGYAIHSLKSLFAIKSVKFGNKKIAVTEITEKLPRLKCSLRKLTNL